MGISAGSSMKPGSKSNVCVIPRAIFSISVAADVERLVQAPAKQEKEADPLHGIDKTDSFFIYPLLGDITPQPDFRRIENQVASALIYGPTSLSEDLKAVQSNSQTWQFFVRKLGGKILKNGMTSRKCDTWLARTRQDRYIQLVQHGRKLSGDRREDACRLAEKMFRVLLWYSYRMMAHCYGVLMTLISVDFSLNNRAGAPTEIEQVLFDLRNRQVDYLGGLPLAFLGRAQLRWIVRTLDTLEACLVQNDWQRYQTRWGSRTDAYADVAGLLGVFGGLVRKRREADRSVKAGRDRPQHVSYDDEIHPQQAREASSAEVDRKDELELDPSTLTRLSSTVCPTCGFELQIDQPLDMTDPANAIVSFYCSECDEYTRYIVNLAALSSSDA